MCTEVAFGRCAVVGIDVNGVVRAGLHAGFAPDTALGAEVDDPIFALIYSGDGTDRDAGWILAMIAASDLKNAARVRKSSLLDVLYPGTIHRERNVIFRLAGHGTGVAADALAIVDDEPVSHSEDGSPILGRAA